ncbi:4-hydroxybenzoyl-CoA thioesterase [Modicisalibacter muralis]|uniref:4-hydroxybenzoyl-CoA thioesterase n=1 Tax=Modicisalibacter muralis TaxID=119000 RepID=A0A1G9GUY1_9GAMM|nr:thioesterase family protein [Halomonas muralis]SDL04481.1 4-hydroxybenzoyl-CoA thioesterase [Halomonas muralis]
MSHFAMQQKVLFQHCDPAGIVFYPRYFEMINAVVEQWFEESLNESFAAIIVAGDGVPTRRIDTDFPRPSRLGETLTFTLDVARLGRSSLDLRIAATCGGEARLNAELTLVRIARADGRPKPWPDAIVDVIESLPASPLGSSLSSSFNKEPSHGKG